MPLEPSADPVSTMYLGIAAEKAGDFALGTRFLAAAVSGLRDQARLGVLTQALTHYAWAATYADDWEPARMAAEEATVLARDTGQPEFGLTAQFIGAIVAALRGEAQEIDRAGRHESADVKEKSAPGDRASGAGCGCAWRGAI